jgi:hypothetical protein
MASTLTAADLDIVSRIAAFRGLKPATIQRVIAPARVVSLGDA